ncbi:radical SAM protein [Mahella australiensis]|jgi:radical SAM protein with 4Fe4S-binding SPASM domain|uniref:Radical SAM domain protein n=1 Tax=Mahella australiensis (strain DSM 15567 / CIP 107919 / 50-1 BON) TaxID=697281 RepID=F3ZXI9_MAHA5|nr:radical SAM protein [Mahella australiensis]AEE97670.1 Radical SAM domain protein [Mahella australiensis 50-1 BON]
MKWNIGWGVISSCNMKCEFCYSKKTRQEVQQLSFSQWKNFIDQNCDSVNSINYGTGENTLSDDWFRLVDYIGTHYPFIRQALTTNGYLVKRVRENAEFDRIVKNCISEIDVSLDYCIPSKHNAFRGFDSAYELAIKTLSYCETNGIISTIVFMGTNLTLEIQNISGLFDIAKAYHSKLRLNIFRPTDGINDHSKRFIADFSKIIDALKWINENHKIIAIDDPLFASVLCDDYEQIDPSGLQSLRILPDGSITPSTYLLKEKFRKFNILENHVLSKIDSTNVGIEFDTPAECAQCRYVDKCRGGVYDRRYLWYGSFNSRDPYCLYRPENYVPDFKVRISKVDSFQSIHHGYLPTMFFGV